MIKQVLTIMAVILCTLLVVAPVSASVINWISLDPGVWNNGMNWDTGMPPGPFDDARHINAALGSTITVSQNESCLSFEGLAGSGRQLILDAGKTFDVGAGGLFGFGPPFFRSS